MAFTVQDFDDLLRLLDERPEWREQLRRRVLGDEILELPALIRQLVEAQDRTEQRLGELALAQSRTEERLAALALAQDRTEHRLDELARIQTQTLERLDRIEARLVKIEDGQQATRRELGSLTNMIGATIEADAEETLRAAIIDHGWTPLGGPVPLALNGDVDLAMQVEEPSGERFWVLVEAKLRLRRNEVLDWGQQLNDPTFRQLLVAEGVPGPVLAYAFGLRVYPEAIEAARGAGIGVLKLNGEQLAPAKRWG
jgi:hypothetical protein